MKYCSNVYRDVIEGSLSFKSELGTILLRPADSSTAAHQHSSLTEIWTEERHFAAAIDASFHLGVTQDDSKQRTTPLVPTTCEAFAADCRHLKGSMWSAYNCRFTNPDAMTSNCRTDIFRVLDMQSKKINSMSNAAKKQRRQALCGYVVRYAVSCPALNPAAVDFGSNSERKPTMELGDQILSLRNKDNILEVSCSILQVLQLRRSLRVALPVSGHGDQIGADGLAAGIQALLKVAESESNDAMHFEMSSIQSNVNCFRGPSMAPSASSAHQAIRIEGGAMSTPVLAPTKPLAVPGTLFSPLILSTAIVTGAFGALGQLTANWLSASWHEWSTTPFSLLLLGRRVLAGAPPSLLPPSSTLEVKSIASDASYREDIENAIGSCSAVLAFHASGTLQDALLPAQSPAKFRKVFAPKVIGGAAMMKALYGSSTEKFVAFSSLACLTGNTGQSNYATANSGLDAAAVAAQFRGTETLSLQWGPWTGRGMATETVARRMKQLGLEMLQPQEGLTAIENLICYKLSLARGPTVIAFAAIQDWAKLLRPSQQSLSVFSEVAPDNSINILDRHPHIKKGAASLVEILEAVRSTAAAATGSTHLDDDATFMSTGLDSLGSTELRNAISTKFSVDLPATVAFDYPSPAALAQHVNTLLLRAAASTGSGSTAVVSIPLQTAAQVEQRVTSIVRGIIGRDIGADDPLMQAGIDSLGATELQSRLSETFNVEMPATLAFDFPSVRSLTGFIAKASLSNASVSSELHKKPKMLPVLRDTSNGAVVCFSSLSSTYPGDSQPQWNDKEILGSFADRLTSAKDLQKVVPSTRWDIDDVYDPSSTTPKSMYVRFGCWLDGIDRFDPEPFRLSRAEAVGIDPQTRMLMERTQEVLYDDATGPSSSKRSSDIGVYVGCMYTEYLDGVLAPSGLADTAATSIVGHGLSFMVGRLSFAFGLQGPCVSTDTACSSSLVAAHLGRHGVIESECAEAVVGGVNMMLIPQTTARICMLKALSEVGRCKALDATADGYGRGEAVAVGLLSMLLRLNEETDAGSSCGTPPEAHAVLVGSGVKQCGRSSGLTAPNGPAQTSLVETCLRAAGVYGGNVAAVSLHGTGTPLGDPIEIGALLAALRPKTEALHTMLTLGASKVSIK